MYYAASTGGFYSKAIHGDNMPADAVEISPERYAELLAGQTTGQRITGDADGNPQLATYVEPPEAAQARVLGVVRAARWPILSILDGLQVSALVAKDTNGAKVIEQAKTDLRNITALPALASPGSYRGLMAAAKAEFTRIASVSDSIAKAVAASPLE